MNNISIVIGVVSAVVIAVVLFLYPPLQAEMPVLSNLEKNVPQITTNITTQPITSMQNTTSGLIIEIITPGAGPEVASGQTVAVDYTGTFTDGKVFDSSIPRGQPLTLKLGSGQVIKGWDLGIVGMKVGEVRKLTISPELAYGSAGAGGVIPPNATLVFEVTLKVIQ